MKHSKCNSKTSSALAHILVGVLIGAIFSAIVMWLWNELMPNLFFLPEISFFQALGLLVLSRLLFGGLSGHFFKHSEARRSSHPMRDKWMHMSSQERKEFMQNRTSSSPISENEEKEPAE